MQIKNVFYSILVPKCDSFAKVSEVFSQPIVDSFSLKFMMYNFTLQSKAALPFTKSRVNCRIRHPLKVNCIIMF